MNKGMGSAQQKSGQKRRNKVLNMKKRRNPNSIKSEPGSKYWSLLVDDEATKMKEEENV